MRKLTVALATILLASPALAQNAPSQPSQNGQSQPQGATASQPHQPTAQIAQQIRNNLEKAGFKNIKLMPSSFLVRATDQNSNPVMMVINPDSITEVSEGQASGGGNTTGQSNSGQQNMQSSGQTNNKH